MALDFIKVEFLQAPAELKPILPCIKKNLRRVPFPKSSDKKPRYVTIPLTFFP